MYLKWNSTLNITTFSLDQDQSLELLAHLHWYLSLWDKFITPFLPMNPHGRVGLADTITADWTLQNQAYEKTQPPCLFCNGCRSRHISSNISMTRIFCLGVENDFVECHKCRFFWFKVETSNFLTILSGTGISAMSNKIKIYFVFERVAANACSEEQTPSTRS